VSDLAHAAIKAFPLDVAERGREGLDYPLVRVEYVAMNLPNEENGREYGALLERVLIIRDRLELADEAKAPNGLDGRLRGRRTARPDNLPDVIELIDKTTEGLVDLSEVLGRAVDFDPRLGGLSEPPANVKGELCPAPGIKIVLDLVHNDVSVLDLDEVIKILPILDGNTRIEATSLEG